MAVIGESIRIHGDLKGAQDLVLEGHIEGKVELPEHQLTVGSSGRVVGEVRARAVLVEGRVSGDVAALERVAVSACGTIEGEVRAPRIAVEEGGVLDGQVRMESPAAAAERGTRAGVAGT